MHCSLLAEDAIKSAIKDYQDKRAKRMAMASVCHQSRVGMLADHWQSALPAGEAAGAAVAA